MSEVIHRQRRPLIALPRVGKPGGVLCCWACGQPWPTRYDLVVDAVASTVRIDDSQPLALSRNELHVISALITAFPRWITRTQLIEHAWDYRPDGDMPEGTVLPPILKRLAAALQGTRYTIERDIKHGVRLVDVDTLLRERGVDDYWANKWAASLAQGTVAALSAARAKKIAGEQKIPNVKLTGKRKVGTRNQLNAAARAAAQQAIHTAGRKPKSRKRKKV